MVQLIKSSYVNLSGVSGTTGFRSMSYYPNPTSKPLLDYLMAGLEMIQAPNTNIRIIYDICNYFCKYFIALFNIFMSSFNLPMPRLHAPHNKPLTLLVL